MADTDIKQKALDALVILNTAVKNVRLYPPTSATIVNAIERLHLAFQDMLDRQAPITFAESEKNILICDSLLNQKDQEKTQVAALLNIFLSLGLRSISFDIGLEKAELSALTEILSRKPDVIESEGGLLQVLANSNITHIHLDQKVYVAVDKDHKIISSLDLNDEQISRFFISMHPELAADTQKLYEMAKDPEWLSQTFKKGLEQLLAQKGTLSDVQITQNLGNMIGLLDKVTKYMEKGDQETISTRIGDAIVTADPDMALQLTSQNMEHLFGGVLLQYLVGKLEDIKYPEELNTGEGGAADGQVQLDLGQTGSDQGDGSIGIDGEGGGQGDGSDGINGDGVGQGNDDVDEKIDFKTKLLKVSEKLSHVLKENEKTLFDEQLMSVLPKIIEQLIAQKEQETIEKIINNLTGNLFSEKAEVRAHAAKSLTDIIKSLPAEREKEMLESLSDKLTEWIIFETEVTPAYKTICHYLQNIVQDFINQVRYEETLPILDAFNNINTGTLKKSEHVFEVCAQVIRSLATEENINTLFKEFKTDEHSKKDEAGKILTDFGDVVTKHMLDTLQEDIDSNERVRIMHLIIEIGDKAIPLVRQRVNKDAPWYYLRNMAYILGQIGNEESAVTLQTLLRHENEKLRNEALKSISKTGGNRRGELLIAVLPDADENFKLNIIEAIGNAKAVDIVPDLLGILTTRPFVTKAARTILEEKICNALGMIGSAKAIPALSEIAKSKSFFRIRTYPDKVKVAAAKALASIRKKQEEVAQIIKTIR